MKCYLKTSKFSWITSNKLLNNFFDVRIKNINYIIQKIKLENRIWINKCIFNELHLLIKLIITPFFTRIIDFGLKD